MPVPQKLDYKLVRYERAGDEDTFGDYNRMCIHLLNLQLPFRIIVTQPLPADGNEVVASKIYYWMLEIHNDSKRHLFPLAMYLQAANLLYLGRYEIPTRGSQKPMGTVGEMAAWFHLLTGEQFIGTELRVKDNGTPVHHSAPPPLPTELEIPDAPDGLLRLWHFPGLRMGDGTIGQGFVQAREYHSDASIWVSAIPDYENGLCMPVIVLLTAVKTEKLFSLSGGWCEKTGVYLNFEPYLWNWAATWVKFHTEYCRRLTPK